MNFKKIILINLLTMPCLLVGYNKTCLPFGQEQSADQDVDYVYEVKTTAQGTQTSCFVVLTDQDSDALYQALEKFNQATVITADLAEEQSGLAVKVMNDFMEMESQQTVGDMLDMLKSRDAQAALEYAGEMM